VLLGDRSALDSVHLLLAVELPVDCPQCLRPHTLLPFLFELQFALVQPFFLLPQLLLSRPLLFYVLHFERQSGAIAANLS
jgi:hypothetical protein